RRASGGGACRRRQAARPARADRIPPAALLHDPPQPGVCAAAAARPRVGRRRVPGGTHGGRAHPAAAQGAPAAWAGRHGADGARRGLPLLGIAGLTPLLATLLALLLAASLGVLAWQRRRLAGLAEAGRRARVESRARNRRLLAMLRAYRAAADTLPDAIVVVERDSQRVAWFNDAATRLLGLRRADIGQPIGPRLQPLPMARWLSGGRHAEPMADVGSPADPALRLQLRLLPYSAELWLLVVRDITKLMRLEHMRRDFVA